jgi:flagellar hook-associated protein 1 FlgK
LSSFRTLNTAVSGLNVAQANLYVTGHNMANVNTYGYSRQSIIQADEFYNNIGMNHTGSLQVGLGSNVQSLRQIRDKYLDKSYRTSAATLGFYNVKYNVGVSIENILGEMEGEYKFQSVLQDLKNSLQELSIDPSSIATRLDFLETCKVFLAKADDTYKNLVEEQNRANDAVIEMTKRCNELLDEIAETSKLIAANEIAGDNANDYRDTRNLALDELAGYLGITYEFNSNGQVDIFCEGAAIMSNGAPTYLGLRYCTRDTNLVEVILTSEERILNYDEEAKLLFEYHTDISSKANNDGGSLKGLIVARGLSHNNWSDTPEIMEERCRRELEDWGINFGVAAFPPTQADLAALPADDRREAEIVMLQYQRDIFNYNNCTVPEAQRRLDDLVHDVVVMINDTFAPRTEPDYDGDPPEFDKTTLPPPYGAVYPYDLLGGNDKYVPVFVRKSSLHPSGADGIDIKDENIYGTDAEDYYSLFTIGNLTLNPLFNSSEGYNYLTLSANGDESDNRLVMDVIHKWQGLTDPVTGEKAPSVDQIYDKIVTDIGIDNNECRKVSESEQEIINQWDNDRQQIMGVAMDEELTNMMKFHHAYNAAARLFNYIDSMLDKIINGTGRVGL